MLDGLSIAQVLGLRLGGLEWPVIILVCLPYQWHALALLATRPLLLLARLLLALINSARLRSARRLGGCRRGLSGGRLRGRWVFLNQLSLTFKIPEILPCRTAPTGRPVADDASAAPGTTLR